MFCHHILWIASVPPLFAYGHNCYYQNPVRISKICMKNMLYPGRISMTASGASTPCRGGAGGGGGVNVGVVERGGGQQFLKFEAWSTRACASSPWAAHPSMRRQVSTRGVRGLLTKRAGSVFHASFFVFNIKNQTTRHRIPRIGNV